MKVIVAGTRYFNNYDLLKETLDNLLTINKNIEIISGGSKGADYLGEKYANENNLKLTIFPADWTLGKKAGYIRNKQMSEYGDALIAFWDNKSQGTKMMIDLAKQKNLKIKVIFY